MYIFLISPLNDLKSILILLNSYIIFKAFNIESKAFIASVKIYSMLLNEILFSKNIFDQYDCWRFMSTVDPHISELNKISTNWPTLVVDDGLPNVAQSLDDLHHWIGRQGASVERESQFDVHFAARGRLLTIGSAFRIFAFCRKGQV